MKKTLTLKKYTSTEKKYMPKYIFSLIEVLSQKQGKLKFKYFGQYAKKDKTATHRIPKETRFPYEKLQVGKVYAVVQLKFSNKNFKWIWAAEVDKNNPIERPQKL